MPALGPLLEKQGFAVVPSGSSLFQAEYEGNIYGGWPVYVTTDAAYNAWHLGFDKILRDLEQQVLLPKLERLVSGLVTAAHAQRVALAHTTLADPASRVEQFYEVAKAELGLPVELGPLARAEKALIDAHSASRDLADPRREDRLLALRAARPLHAERRPEALLRRHVRARPVRRSACRERGTARGSSPPGSGSSPPSLLGDQGSASNVALALDLRPDRLPRRARRRLHARGGRRRGAQGGRVHGHGRLREGRERAQGRRTRSSPPASVQIDPQRASIRIMGTRFTVDEFLLDQLVYPRVGTAAKPRLLPSGLDLAASFGSTFATATQQLNGASSYANYDSQLAQNQAAVAARPAGRLGLDGLRRLARRAPAAVRPARQGVPRLHAHGRLGRQGRPDRASAPTPSSSTTRSCSPSSSSPRPAATSSRPTRGTGSSRIRSPSSGSPPSPTCCSRGSRSEGS